MTPTDPFQRALAARKMCFCGESVEALRFLCPRCGSDNFLVPELDAELSRAIETSQRRSQQHNDQGGRLFELGLLDEALDEWRAAIKANPWNAASHVNVGAVYLQRDQPSEALRWFERALAIDPRRENAKDGAETARRLLR